MVALVGWCCSCRRRFTAFPPATNSCSAPPATLVGACLRFPYTFATAKFGGRNWTVFSALVLLIPSVGTMVLLAHPGLSL